MGTDIGQVGRGFVHVVAALVMFSCELLLLDFSGVTQSDSTVCKYCSVQVVISVSY